MGGPHYGSSCCAVCTVHRSRLLACWGCMTDACNGFADFWEESRKDGDTERQPNVQILSSFLFSPYMYARVSVCCTRWHKLWFAGKGLAHNVDGLNIYAPFWQLVLCFIHTRISILAPPCLLSFTGISQLNEFWMKKRVSPKGVLWFKPSLSHRHLLLIMAYSLDSEEGHIVPFLCSELWSNPKNDSLQYLRFLKLSQRASCVILTVVFFNAFIRPRPLIVIWKFWDT